MAAVYIALIGDLVASRKIEQRAQAQRALQQVLAEANARFADRLASKLTLTLGDEFQALIKLPEQDAAGAPIFSVLQIYDTLADRLRAYPFRAGLGIGAIHTAIDPKLSIGADGPAYWQARAAITQAHAEGGRANCLFAGGSAQVDRVINQLLQAAQAIAAGWSKGQREVFSKLLQAGIYTPQFAQKPFAEKEGLSESGLSKALGKGNVRLFLSLRQLTDELIAQEARAL